MIHSLAMYSSIILESISDNIGWKQCSYRLPLLTPDDVTLCKIFSIRKYKDLSILSVYKWYNHTVYFCMLHTRMCSFSTEMVSELGQKNFFVEEKLVAEVDIKN